MRYGDTELFLLGAGLPDLIPVIQVTHCAATQSATLPITVVSRSGVLTANQHGSRGAGEDRGQGIRRQNQDPSGDQRGTFQGVVLLSSPHPG